MQEEELRLSKGSWVSHPRMPAWGYGKILELIGGNKGRVFFLLAGEKKMSWEHAGLIPVESDDASRAALNAQLSEFRLTLATDMLTNVETGSGGVSCTLCDTPGSRCELCKGQSENLRSYSLGKRGKLSFCDNCRDKIMLEIGDRAGMSESIAKMESRGKKEMTAKVAKKLGKKYK
ncbi:MAG: DUF3553 domain-containing protein [Syntrophobacteraceae bacterium]|nr:DUF3553 domain-containing protein [Syntrophobacteraceae bacterium]